MRPHRQAGRFSERFLVVAKHRGLRESGQKRGVGIRGHKKQAVFYLYTSKGALALKCFHSQWVRCPEAGYGLVGGTGLGVDCMGRERVCLESCQMSRGLAQGIFTFFMGVPGQRGAGSGVPTREAGQDFFMAAQLQFAQTATWVSAWTLASARGFSLCRIRAQQPGPGPAELSEARLVKIAAARRSLLAFIAIMSFGLWAAQVERLSSSHTPPGRKPLRKSNSTALLRVFNAPGVYLLQCL